MKGCLHVLPTHDYEIVHPTQADESRVVVGLFSLEIHNRSLLHCREHQQQQHAAEVLGLARKSRICLGIFYRKGQIERSLKSVWWC